MGRERPVDVHAENARVLADVEVTAPAFVAMPADQVRLAGHAGPESRAVDALAPGDDLTADLVADHPWWMDPCRRPWVPVVEMDVGAADRGGRNAEQHLTRGRLRYGDLADHETRGGSGFEDGEH